MTDARPMGAKRFGLGVAAGVVAVTMLGAAAAVFAGPREEAASIVEQWVAAFTASDVDAITRLYAADATFIGTSSRQVLTTPAEIRAYFEQSLLNNRPRGATLGEHAIVPLSATEVLVTGLDTVTSVRAGEPVSMRGRVTFIIAARGDAWRIVHFHRSALPN